MAVLELENVHAYYGMIHALKGVSLAVGEGEIVTLIGSNGAGKSTTLKAISGLVRPRDGRISLEGRPIGGLKAHEIAEKRVAHCPEGRKIFPRLSVRENLEMGAFVCRSTAEVKQSLEKVTELFPRLRERLGQKGGTLSGGEQQMLAIARALMMQPRILLLDEPSMGLAPVLVEQIFQIIQNLNRAGTTILLVEQNALQALQVAHRGYVIQTGNIVLADKAAHLRQNEMVRRVYLGES